MFPLNPVDELVFGNPTSDTVYQAEFAGFGNPTSDALYQTEFGNPTSDAVYQQHVYIMDDEFAETKSINFASTSSNMKTEVRRNEAELMSNRERAEEMRRTMHRDIERKRRQEMSQLYDTLRSLIPPEQMKGKRSISDLMKEATNYTKQLKKNVQELGSKKDKLKGTSTSSLNTRIGSNNNVPNHVTVNQEQDGIEVLINTCSEFGLSRVMIELLAIELEVVSCISTKLDNRFLHKILAQASDTGLVDLPKLQQRLTEVVNLSLG